MTFFSSKMLSVTEYRSEEAGAQLTRPKSTSVATESAEQKTGPKTSIKCDIDNCKKQFKDEKALEAHKLAKHRSISSNQIQDSIQ